MRIFLFIYTVFMLASSFFTLVLVPRALRDLGHERQRLKEQLPEADFDVMVEAGYRVNTFLLLLEILYYYLLLGFGGAEWQFLYGGFVFGIIHIGYLIASRLEKRRLSRGAAHTRAARVMVWLTALLTAVEICFLVWVSYLLLLPESAA
jgi:hypothetical protein